MHANKTTWARWTGTALLVGIVGWMLTPMALAQGFSGGTAAGAATGMSGLSGGASGMSGGMSGMSGGMSGMSGGSAFSSTGSMAGGGSFSGGGNALGITGGINGLGMAGGYGMGMSGAGISPTNLLGSYYVNPLSLGLNVQTGIGTTPVGAFGLPTYGTAAMSMNMSGGMSGSMLGTMAGGMSGLGNGMRGMGGTSTGMGAAMQPPFTMVLQAPAGGLSITGTPPQAFARRNVALEQTVLNVLASSSALPSKEGILVAVTGETVILRGTVSDLHQKRMAEALLRLTPGVRDVLNEIQVR